MKSVYKNVLTNKCCTYTYFAGWLVLCSLLDIDHCVLLLQVNRAYGIFHRYLSYSCHLLTDFAYPYAFLEMSIWHHLLRNHYHNSHCYDSLWQFCREKDLYKWTEKCKKQIKKKIAMPMRLGLSITNWIITTNLPYSLALVSSFKTCLPSAICCSKFVKIFLEECIS